MTAMQDQVDRETGRHDEHLALRLWLRMLTCTTMIENELRNRLRARFDVTLAQFDLLAQLFRNPDTPLAMRDLSARLMVSNGNVTALADRLESLGLITRQPSPEDRRRQLVSLTEQGRRKFAEMAQTHEGWIRDLFRQVAEDDQEELMRYLAVVKGSAAQGRGEG